MAVTVTTGKTHSRHCRMLLDGHNVSGDARQIQNVGLSYPPQDNAGWDSDLDVFMHGRPMLAFGPFQALFNQRNGATGPVNAGAFTVLKDIDVAIASLFIGMSEAPTIGCPSFFADVKHFSSPVEVGDNAPLVIGGNFNGAVSGVAGWGQALAVGTSISSTTNNGSLDNGASTSDGWRAALHIAQSVGSMGSNDWEAKLQHSSNDSDWSDLGSPFTLDGSAVAAEIISGSGTVNRYVRAVFTKTAGNDIVPWLTFKRL